MATKTRQRTAVEKRVEAMKHPLRRAILRHLIEKGETSPVEISWALDEPLWSVSHHVRRLADLGCIERTKTEQVRGALKSFYVPAERHFVDNDEWDDLDVETKEGLVVDFMEPLVQDFTGSLLAGILARDDSWHITRSPISAMDRQGFEDLLKAHRALFDQVSVIQSESLQRMATSGEKSIAVSSGQACFEVAGF